MGIKKIRIENFKSIQKQDIPLTNVNVFIGENGCGKSNILEAMAMLAAAKSGNLTNESLFIRGVRVTKPTLTYNSFLGIPQKQKINISIEDTDDQLISAVLSCPDNENIFSTWQDSGTKYVDEILTPKFGQKLSVELKDLIFEEINKRFLHNNSGKKSEKELKNDIEKYFAGLMPSLEDRTNMQVQQDISTDVFFNYVIYSLHTNALRGISNESKKEPLGINGEGLDMLIASLDKKQKEELMKYSKFIDWLYDFDVDVDGVLKNGGHKLGRSISNLYFTDKYMLRKNNMFAAENANEGALHILGYLALFISSKTPSFFAIDNIETALNPKLCRDLMSAICELAKKYNKQVLITTHNPAILDGLNLHDETQSLFVVKRTDEGYTKTDRIKIKPSIDGERLKLSELWMRGYLGALPSYSF